MWVLKKDGLWLMAWRPGACREVIASGVQVTVPMCVWGERERDAMPFGEWESAARIARIVGAAIVKI